MHLNYTVTDFIAALVSTLLFAPLLLPVGYVTGWFTNIFEFRVSTPPWRIISALAIAAAVCPTLSFWISWIAGWPGAFILFGAFLISTLALFGGVSGHEKIGAWLAGFRGIGWAAYAIPFAWLLIALLSLIDLQIGDRLYFNVSSFDHSLRTEFTHSITRTGVPPVNPLFHLGSAAALRYHYFWFILCSLVERMGGWLLNGSQPDSILNARQSMMGSIVWAGWSLAATIPMYFRFFYAHTGSALKRRALIGVLLLAVTGLDLVPTLIYYAHWHYLYPDMEWWNSPVCAWFSSLLWVPHQVIALVAGLVGFLIAWQGAQKGTRASLVIAAVLAGFAFATAVGTSVFVTLVFALFFFAWMAICFRNGWRTHITVLVLSGIVAIVLLAPHLLHIASKGGGGAFIRLHFRDFTPIDRIVTSHHWPRAIHFALKLVFLPVNYALELGFFLLGGALYWFRWRRSTRLSQQDSAALLLVLVSAGICTFFSSALVNNDLGVRGFMPAQFVLLLWSADWLARWREDTASAGVLRFKWARPVARASLAIGAAGTLYAVLLFRFYGVVTDTGISKSEFFPQGETGRRTYEFRAAYEQLRHMLPPNAIVQTNPAGKYNDFPFGLYALRQSASMNDTCGAEFGGDPKICKANYNSIEDIFSNGHHPSPEAVTALCRRFSIDALVLRNTDGAWRDASSWAWQMQPALANAYVRVYVVSSRMLAGIAPQSAAGAGPGITPP